MRVWHYYCAFLMIALVGVYTPKSSHAVNGQERILMALMEGSMVVYIRHPHAIVGVDLDTSDLNDCSNQRRLTDQGRADSVMIGSAFKNRGIPVGEIYASPFCRTKNAAFIAFGYDKTIVEPGLRSSCKTTMESLHFTRSWLRQRLSTKPTDGKNVVLMGHNCNIRNVLPPDEFPDCARRPEMGDALVFQPKEGGYNLVGCVALPALKAWGGAANQMLSQSAQ